MRVRAILLTGRGGVEQRCVDGVAKATCTYCAYAVMLACRLADFNPSPSPPLVFPSRSMLSPRWPRHRHDGQWQWMAVTRWYDRTRQRAVSALLLPRICCTSVAVGAPCTFVLLSCCSMCMDSFSRFTAACRCLRPPTSTPKTMHTNKLTSLPHSFFFSIPALAVCFAFRFPVCAFPVVGFFKLKATMGETAACARAYPRQTSTAGETTTASTRMPSAWTTTTATEGS